MSYQTSEEAEDVLGATCARYLDTKSFREAIAKIKADAVRDFLEHFDPSEMSPGRTGRYIVDLEDGVL